MTAVRDALRARYSKPELIALGLLARGYGAGHGHGEEFTRARSAWSTVPASPAARCLPSGRCLRSGRSLPFGRCLPSGRCKPDGELALTNPPRVSPQAPGRGI